MLIAGTNAVAVDAVCAKFMGFDWQRLPSIKNAFNIKHFPICNFNYEDICIVSTLSHLNRKIGDLSNTESFQFKPHLGWRNHLESIIIDSAV